MVSQGVKFEENMTFRKSQDLPTIVEGHNGEEPKEEPRAEISSSRDSQPSVQEEQ